MIVDLIAPRQADRICPSAEYRPPSRVGYRNQNNVMNVGPLLLVPGVTPQFDRKFPPGDFVDVIVAESDNTSQWTNKYEFELMKRWLSQFALIEKQEEGVLIPPPPKNQTVETGSE